LPWTALTVEEQPEKAAISVDGTAGPR
jgi:hypothetical protein